MAFGFTLQAVGLVCMAFVTAFAVSPVKISDLQTPKKAEQIDFEEVQRDTENAESEKTHIGR